MMMSGYCVIALSVRMKLICPPDYISVDAPLARGLLGKRLDDEVTLELPKGVVNYSIIAIHYQCPSWDKKVWPGFHSGYL